KEWCRLGQDAWGALRAGEIARSGEGQPRSQFIAASENFIQREGPDGSCSRVEQTARSARGLRFLDLLGQFRDIVQGFLQDVGGLAHRDLSDIGVRSFLLEEQTAR